ncbi:hypothetical protein [Pelovirga terrestris]|uniref:Uncharacterized protein n=1 Tax=Pelovirga terrestris TaxID=2771352 RepID=A0A8J6QL47_9BACT|nr:hypothetical protein [Pelovirga terrestris]MBD1400309.1 hypothetical protein [Pelovirga terrestris]
MKYFTRARLLFLLFLLVLTVGCTGPAKRLDPVNAIALSAPIAPGFELHRVSSDLGLVLEILPEHWQATTEATAQMIEHQAEHEEENAINAGKQISRAEAMERARRFFENSKDLYFLNTRSEAHFLFSFAKLKPQQPEPTAGHIAGSALAAMSGVTAEGWTKHVEDHRPVQVKGTQHAHYFEIDYTQHGERQTFKGVVGYAQPYWFWFYTYDHLQDPQDQRMLKRLLETFEIRTEALQ